MIYCQHLVIFTWYILCTSEIYLLYYLHDILASVFTFSFHHVLFSFAKSGYGFTSIISNTICSKNNARRFILTGANVLPAICTWTLADMLNLINEIEILRLVFREQLIHNRRISKMVSNAIKFKFLKNENVSYMIYQTFKASFRAKFFQTIWLEPLVKRSLLKQRWRKGEGKSS